MVYDKGSLVSLCTQDHKSLCAADTICTTLIDPKFDFLNFLTHVASKNRSNRGCICQLVHSRQIPAVLIWWP